MTCNAGSDQTENAENLDWLLAFIHERDVATVGRVSQDGEMKKDAQAIRAYAIEKVV